MGYDRSPLLGAGYMVSEEPVKNWDDQSVVDPVNCPASCCRADTMWGVYQGTSTPTLASTTFYPGSVNSFGFPNFDPNAGNYHSFIQKPMAHEIGLWALTTNLLWKGSTAEVRLQASRI